MDRANELSFWEEEGGGLRRVSIILWLLFVVTSECYWECEFTVRYLSHTWLPRHVTVNSNQRPWHATIVTTVVPRLTFVVHTGGLSTTVEIARRRISFTHHATCNARSHMCDCDCTVELSSITVASRLFPVHNEAAVNSVCTAAPRTINLHSNQTQTHYRFWAFDTIAVVKTLKNFNSVNKITSTFGKVHCHSMWKTVVDQRGCFSALGLD